MAKKRAVNKKIERKTENSSFLKRHSFNIVIFLFSFLLFANSIPNDYNLDDELVTINHRLTSKGLAAIPEIFTSSYYEDNMGYAYEYRPVVLSAFALEHQFFGDNPHVSHFFNVLLYALACLLLFVVLSNISNFFSPNLALVTTLLFAAHSSHTEVVSSIKNRDEILGLIFCLLTLLVALKSVLNAKKIFLLLLPLLFALALMNKITFLPFAAIIPLALILFTEANLVTLLIVSTSLAIPSFLLINTGNFADKVFISSGLAIAPILLTLFFRSNTVLEFLKNLLTRLSKPIEQPIETYESDNGFEGFKGFFSGLPPPGSYFTFYPVAPMLSLAVVYFVGFYSKLPIVEIICFALMVFLALMGNEKWSWWANVLISLCLAASVFRWNDDLLIDLVGITLSYRVFFGTRKFRDPVSIVMVIYLSVNAIFAENLGPLFYILGLAAMRTRVKWLVGIAIIASALFNIYEANEGFITSFKTFWHFNSTHALNYYEGVIVIPLIVSILIKKRAVYLIWGFKIFAFFLLISHQVLTDNSSPVKIKNQIENIGKDINTNVIDEKQDRPISFLEQPVSPNDPWQVRTGTSLRVLFHYFIKTIVPYPLAFYYGYKFIAPEEISKPVPLLSLLIYSILLAALFYFRYDRIIAFGIGVYLISIVTFANYFAPIPGIVGDRYLLIPSLGWSIVLAVALFRIWKLNTVTRGLLFSQIPRGFKYTLVLILCFYSTISFSRNFQWKDRITLYRHDIKYVDQSAMCHRLLGINIMKASEEESDTSRQTILKKEALGHFLKAQEIYPDFLNVASDIGRVYISLNMVDSAISAFRYATEIGSTYIGVYKNLADLLLSKNKYEEAIPYYEHLIEATPTEFYSYDRISYIYFVQRKYQKSIAANRKAIVQFPNLVDPVFNIGRTYLEINQFDSARFYFLQASKMSPGNPLPAQLLQQIENR